MHKLEQFDNIFASSPRDTFTSDALTAQNSLGVIPNPYVGNKRKILPDIGLALYDALEWDSIHNVCDLFMGSSVVSAFFRMLGKTVTCNDILQSSYLNGIALLNGQEGRISKEEWRFLTENDNKNKANFVEAKYGDIRFTIRECKFIDNYYANCKAVFGDAVSVKMAVAHTSLIHFIMSHCYVGGRLNSGQVIAGLKHRLEHQRNQNKEMAFHKMKPFLFNITGPHSHCNHGDVFDFLKANQTKFDLIYIDPPYGGQQSDYAFMYQFFEEYLAQQEIGEIPYLKDASKKFVKAKTYKESFADLLAALPGNAAWAISYNNSSWADITTISDMVKPFKKKVEVKELSYEYKCRAEDNTSGVEYVIIGQ
jgi:adenine-specific DNA methylase